MDKIKLEFGKKDPLETVQMGKDIKKNMAEAAANFPAPEPSDADFQLVIDGAEVANQEYEASKKATEAKMLVRDEKLELLRDAIRGRAAYAEKAVLGDPAKLQPVFSLRAERAPIGDLAQVAHLAVTVGDEEGELDASWDKLRGAKSYEVQISIDPPTSSSWQHKAVATKSRCTLEGLTSGAKIWVRVRGIGAAGAGPWSDPAAKTVP